MAKQDIQLDIPSDEGRIVYGTVVSASEFQATVRPPLFRTVVPDPLRLARRAHRPGLCGVHVEGGEGGGGVHAAGRLVDPGPAADRDRRVARSRGDRYPG